jgi:CRISPR/Cas system-associated endonuclease Cas3-HD
MLKIRGLRRREGCRSSAKRTSFLSLHLARTVSKFNKAVAVAIVARSRV